METPPRRLGLAEYTHNLRTRFWRPPRGHEEDTEDATVSFLELFYDLVYVVLIARASHGLAENVSWRGVADFAVVFAMIWQAWLNGTTYQQQNGGSDLRSRNLIFGQMLLLGLLATYAGEATGDGGAEFGAIYAVLFALYTFMWFSVYQIETPEYRTSIRPYIMGMGTSTLIFGLSTMLADGPRTALWAAVVVGWLVYTLVVMGASARGEQLSAVFTDAVIERFGLFTIIVLGEVFVGVVDGLSEHPGDLLTTVTALLGLSVGFGLWWTYFDFVSERAPRNDRAGWWVSAHLPLTVSIAASGAAMVSLLEHASEPRSPIATSWLLSGAVALMLVSIFVLLPSLSSYGEQLHIYKPLGRALLIGSVLSLLVGWLRPAPWILVTAMFALTSFVWNVAVYNWVRAEPDV